MLGVRSERELAGSPFAAAVWETLVCAELRRRLRHRKREGDLFFWRDRVKEVDFLVHRGGRFDLYEAKWTEHPDAHDAAALGRLAAELGKRAVASASVVCRARHAYPLTGGVRAVPLSGLPTE